MYVSFCSFIITKFFRFFDLMKSYFKFQSDAVISWPLSSCLAPTNNCSAVWAVFAVKEVKVPDILERNVHWTAVRDGSVISWKSVLTYFVLEILWSSKIVGTRRKVENLTDAKNSPAGTKWSLLLIKLTKGEKDVDKERELLEIHGC